MINQAQQAAMDRGCAHLRINLPPATDIELTQLWYSEYTGKMTCQEFIADYNRMRQEQN